MHSPLATLLLLVAGASIVGCRDNTGPVGADPCLPISRSGDYHLWDAPLPGQLLNFVSLDSTAPLLETVDTSFWAVKGEERQLEIGYEFADGALAGDGFLKLTIDRETLHRWPDGTAFAPGDSVQIRVAVTPWYFLAQFEPAGLKFNPNEPAELEIHYEMAEDWFLEREPEFQIWRQERPGELWEPVESEQSEELDQIKAALHGFTRYALAVGR